MKIFRRHSDGALFRLRSYYDYSDMLVDILKPSYVVNLIEVKQCPRKWWHFKERFVDTGNIWKAKFDEFSRVQ